METKGKEIDMPEVGGRHYSYTKKGKRAGVVEIGVTHTISQKNPNGTYSKKKFKTPHEARLASLKYAEEIKRMIQSYKETKLTDEQWLEGLEYFDRSGRKKGSGS